MATCEASTSSWPEELYVYDGLAASGIPRLLGTLLTADDGIDGRGLRYVGVLSYQGQGLITEARGYGPEDPNAVLGWVVRDNFYWDGDRFLRGERRIVLPS